MNLDIFTKDNLLFMAKGLQLLSRYLDEIANEPAALQ